MRAYILLIGLKSMVLFSTNDPFYYLDNPAVTDSEPIRNVARSWFTTSRTLALAIIVISGVIAATTYAISHSPKKIGEAKASLIFKFAVVILIFSSVWLLSTLMDITNNIFK